jgi:hypothetical protein
MLKTIDVSRGTILEHGSIFTSGPKPENLPKRYSVENVQKNYVSLLFERNTSGNVDSTPLQIRNAAFIPMLERQGLSAAEIGKLRVRMSFFTDRFVDQAVPVCSGILTRRRLSATWTSIGVCPLTSPSRVTSRGSALVVIVTPRACIWWRPGIPDNSAG